MTHGRQPLPAHQAVATSIVNNRNVPIVCSFLLAVWGDFEEPDVIQQTHNHGPPYNRAHTSNITSQHGQFNQFRAEQNRAPLPNLQRQQPHLPLNGSTHTVNQNVYRHHETVRVSHPVGGAGAAAIVSSHKP